MVNPSPTPGTAWMPGMLPRSKGLKTLSISSGRMPMPLSLTSNSATWLEG